MIVQSVKKQDVMSASHARKIVRARNKMEKIFKYTKTINPDIAKSFAKSKCKQCLGRGLINGVYPSGEKYTDYCVCVTRNLKKQKISY
jgi:hypothetical protein